MKYHAVLFDLDGTLLDTLEDLADAMNAALEELGCPAVSIEQCRVFVGDGRDVFARRALPESRRDEQTVARCVELMTDHYSQNWTCKTRPYDGVAELLPALTNAGLHLAVLSNKYDEVVRDSITHFFGDRFEIVRGERDGVPSKPDPTAALQIARRLDVPPAEFLYLGDTDTDMKTAVAAGMYPVGAMWGFRTVEELIANGAKTVLSHPTDMLALIAEG